MKINYNAGRVTAIDNNGNEVLYIQKGNLLEVLVAEFNGVIYEKTSSGWKRSKRGAVSKSFYNWFEEFDKAVYNKHYNISIND